MKTTLTALFRTRNRIKEKISDLSRLIDEMPASYPASEILDLSRFDGRTLQEVIEEIDHVQWILDAVNEKISRANASGPEALVLQINGVKDSIRRYESYYAKAYQQPKEDVDVNRVTGVSTRTPRTQVLDLSALRSSLKTLKAKKMALEDKLSELNARTEVDVSDIEENLRKLLG